ncbi:FtsQ-type POTRA domain-containing protein [Streptomyces sp. ICN441]|uniref:Cell division protein FtsQ n=1 Tax=Streptomyces tirandamycinicus TaxID=2174846 RepID=A0A2S1SNK8_9ACTN|nr:MULTISPECIES: FtsQ-type POTRA domain-containing protein [Streptomyces]AWI27988.1 cell division protein FtsQ [Streptomyces tirandamycinicus]TFE56736.1 FtsQ-type POTRA domain-containing protein [Streptomyces sp. ICN441]
MAGPTTAERGTRKPGGRPPAGRDRKGPPPRRRRLPAPRLLVSLLAAAVLTGGGLWVLYGSSWVRAERVEVSGTRVLTPREVELAAGVPLGSPMVSVDLDRIESRLRDRLARIDSVEAERSWPHGVELRVTERKPVLLMRKGARYVEVDAKGVRFATVDKAPKAVPLVELTADQSPGVRRFGGQRLLKEAALVVSRLPAPIVKDLLSVQVISYDSLTLKLTRDREVMWGSSEKSEVKARALTALMKAAPRAGRFDVSAPTAPAASAS